MNREVKFRCWWRHPEYMPKGKMFGVGGLMFGMQAEDGESELGFDDRGPIEIGLIDHYRRASIGKVGWNDASTCKIMQFIGFRDKNSIDYYEGDIFRSDLGHVMWVVWDERTAGFALRRNGWAYNHFFNEAVDPSECEIIGNIYENPELIKLPIA